MGSTELNWAADYCRRSAEKAIEAARGTRRGYEKSGYLKVAAQNLRDERTFRSEAGLAILRNEG